MGFLNALRLETMEEKGAEKYLHLGGRRTTGRQCTRINRRSTSRLGPWFSVSRQHSTSGLVWQQGRNLRRRWSTRVKLYWECRGAQLGRTLGNPRSLRLWFILVVRGMPGV